MKAVPLTAAVPEPEPNEKSIFLRIFVTEKALLLANTRVSCDYTLYSSITKQITSLSEANFSLYHPKKSLEFSVPPRRQCMYTVETVLPVSMYPP